MGKSDWSFTDLGALVDRVLEGRPPPRDAALALLRLRDEETLPLVAAAARVRRALRGSGVRLNVLLNAKSGRCGEDCAYCSQSRVSRAAVPRYPLLPVETILARARAAYRAGAGRFCIVTSGRGPTPEEVRLLAEAVRRIKAELPLEVCTSLGLLEEEAARELRAAGVDAYNHNLNTTPGRYARICRTHTYADRLRTLGAAARAGLRLCAGVLFGLGETQEEVLELAYALRDLGPASVPVNFLLPVAGTPLGHGATVAGLTPWACLRRLAVLRLVLPRVELRVAAGREAHLRSLQGLALLVADSVFLGDYLTQRGAPPAADFALLADLGLAPVAP